MSESTFETAGAQRADQELSLKAAVGQLLGTGRELVADAADLVAAEAHVALQVLTALVIAAVCGAVLGVLAAVGLLAAIAMGLIEHGISGVAATGAVALLCAIGAVWFVRRLRSLARHALFVRSRRQLRGHG
ncbi:MAG TPA: hypothetical protein VGK37_05640 [Casimicrobiaceae bacterium]